TVLRESLSIQLLPRQRPSQRDYNRSNIPKDRTKWCPFSNRKKEKHGRQGEERRANPLVVQKPRAWLHLGSGDDKSCPNAYHRQPQANIQRNLGHPSIPCIGHTPGGTVWMRVQTVTG